MIDFNPLFCALLGHKWSNWIDKYEKNNWSRRDCSRCRIYQLYDHRMAWLNEFEEDNKLIGGWDIDKEPYMLNDEGLFKIFFRELDPIFGILIGIVTGGYILFNFFHRNK